MSTPTIPEFVTRHRMRLALEESGVDVAQMAAELGVTKQTVHNYLRGDRQPIKAVLKEWARVCQVPFEWIETGKLPPPDESPGNVLVNIRLLHDLVSA